MSESFSTLPVEEDVKAYPMFSVPIFKLQIRDWDIKKPKLLELYKQKELSLKDNVLTNYNREEKESFQPVVDIIESDINRFGDAVGCTSIIPQWWWFEKSIYGMNHTVHNHGSIGYSAVLFIEYDPEVHTPTTFVSPFGDFMKGITMTHQPDDITEGSLIIFPAATNHYTEVNQSDKERIILSFNMIIER